MVSGLRLNGKELGALVQGLQNLYASVRFRPAPPVFTLISQSPVESRKNLDCAKMEDGIDACGSRDELLLLGFGDRVKILTNIHS